VLLEENRNTVLGVAIFIGFVGFLIIDKTMRILSGGEGHDHSHHAPAPSTKSTDGVSTSTDTKSEKDGLRRRKGDSNEVATPATVVEEPVKQVKVSAWLCIISDFTHNITDGLAISASFYISPSIGAVTTMAVFFHGNSLQTLTNFQKFLMRLAILLSSFNLDLRNIRLFCHSYLQHSVHSSEQLLALRFSISLQVVMMMELSSKVSSVLRLQSGI
jgi:zinc transporter ZupT